MTLLLVEDDLEDRRLVASQLQAADLQPQIESVGTLAEALDRLNDRAEHGIAVVLLDLGLPDCQGLDTLSRVATAAADVPVIVLTGQDDGRELAVAALRRGAHDYLVKGRTGSGELGRSIRYAIERHHLQQRSSEQLLHQAALHQLEVAASTAADVRRFIAAAANAVQGGINARRVSVRLLGDASPETATATAVEGSFRDSADRDQAPSSDLTDVTDHNVTTIDLTGTSSGRLGTLTVGLPAGRQLTADEQRFLTTAAASVVARVERIAAAAALTTRTRQLDTVHRVAERLQQERDPAMALQAVVDLLAAGVGSPDRIGVRVEIEQHVATCGEVAPAAASLLEAVITVSGEEVGTVQLLRAADDAWSPDERTVVDGVAAQLGTWWALSRADQEHRRDVDRIAQLMETAPVGLALVGPRGIVRFANATALELVGADDVAEFPWQFDDRGDVDPALAAITQVRHRGRPVRDVRVAVEQPDGSERVLAVNASPLAPTPDGRGLALAMIDVTAERRRAVLLESALDREQQSAEELRKVATLKDGFLRAVSHELRTPLAAIFGFTETLRDHGPDLDADQTHSMLERLHANAQRLALLLEDLLDVGRITAGVAAAPDRRPHDLASVVTDIVRLLPDDSHDIQLDLDEAIGAVEGPKVERIVHNLLGNALRHTPPGTAVRVSTRRDDDAIVLVVEDDGPGIPSADRPLVFEPFVQGKAASSSASPGTGVGLSLVQQFVDLHGGTVELDDSPTGGARFTVRFPAH